MIKIGQCVYYLLSGDTSIKGYVGTKIFPIVVPEKTEAPFIVYERRGDLDYNKDSVGLYRTLVDVTVVSEGYTDGINITDRVKEVLENYKGILFGINIRDVELYNIDEGWSDGLYAQKISFTFKTN